MATFSRQIHGDNKIKAVVQPSQRKPPLKAQ